MKEGVFLLSSLIVNYLSITIINSGISYITDIELMFLLSNDTPTFSISLTLTFLPIITSAISLVYYKNNYEKFKASTTIWSYFGAIAVLLYLLKYDPFHGDGAMLIILIAQRIFAGKIENYIWEK